MKCKLLSILLCYFLFTSTAFAFSDSKPSPELNENTYFSADDIEVKAPPRYLKDYHIVSISGVVAISPTGDNVGYRTEYFDRKLQGYNLNTTFTTKYYYDRDKPITVTFYQDGTGIGVGFPLSKDYTTERSQIYDYTLDSYGAAKTWKFDETITNINPTLSVLQLTSKAYPHYSPDNKFIRNLNIRLKDSHK